MRSYGATLLAHLQARKPIDVKTLIWITAKNRTTGLPETLGLWSGVDHATITVEGAPRDYYGVGNILGVEDISAEIGLQVRTHKIALSPFSPEVELAIRGYDPRLAPVQIHRLIRDPETNAILDAPHRIFAGWIDEVEMRSEPIGSEGLEGFCEVTLASATRELTRPLALRRSDESQKRRSGDRFFRHVDVSGAVPVYWGEAEK